MLKIPSICFCFYTYMHSGGGVPHPCKYSQTVCNVFESFYEIYLRFMFIMNVCNIYQMLQSKELTPNICKQMFCIILYIQIDIRKCIYIYIYNMLKRRKESDTYLATDSRHRWSAQMTMKNDN